jgi:malonyl-CoA/methylmalonyl-CoA synthetase
VNTAANAAEPPPSSAAARRPGPSEDCGSFFSLVAARVAARAAHPFIVTPEGRTVMYGEMLDRTAQMARALSARGVARGDRVAVKVAKSPEQILLYLACLRAGFVYLPINPAFKSTETAHIVDDAAPAAVVCMPGEEEALRSISANCRGVPILSLDDRGEGSFSPACTTEPKNFDGPACGADDLAVILYTSGTTGRPKGAMLTHGNIAANGLALSAFWQFTPDDVLLHGLPAFHSHGLFVSLSCSLLSASRVMLCQKFDVEQTIGLFPHVSVFMGVPTMYTRLLASPRLSRAGCRSVRLFACGSAPLPADRFAAFAQRSGQRIVERYGMSETAINTSNPIDGDRRPGTVGLPLPGVEVRIAAPDGTPLPDGAAGAVHVRGAHVFKGYWRQSAQTSQALRPDGWFNTGDLGTLDGDGYLTLVGRATDLIISGGYNVYPLEVEGVIDRIAGVAEASVIGLPHPDFGEAVTAVVVRNTAAPSEAAIISQVKGALAAYKAPKRIVFVDELPRNDIGKVQKNVLREVRNLYDA